MSTRECAITISNGSFTISLTTKYEKGSRIQKKFFQGYKSYVAAEQDVDRLLQHLVDRKRVHFFQKTLESTTRGKKRPNSFSDGTLYGSVRKIKKKKNGKAVEIPDILKWFKEEHALVVTRMELYYAMKKLGFLFGKTKKLLLRRESDRITKLRRQYLQRRVLQDVEISERNSSMVIHSDGVEGPNQRQLCYLYLDKSYVNRNHSRGETWYHPEDEYGCATNLPSGKGERLVMLTRKFGI
jgi:hypothetical protein